MKLTILRENLNKSLSLTKRATAKSPTLPILNNILISAEKNFLELAATDLELGVKSWSLAKINKSGKITVPAQLFSNLVNSLSSKQINLSTKEKSLILKTQKRKTKIKGLSHKDFPIIPKIDKEKTIEVDRKDFTQGLAQVIDTTASSKTRPEISGVFISFQKKLIEMVATDSFRLAHKKISTDYDLPSSKPISLILPHKAVREIITIAEEKKGPIKIYFSSNQVMFEFPMKETDHPEAQVTARLIEGEYPDYQQVIPKKTATQITVPKQDFLNQIKTAGLFSGKINEVKLKVDSSQKILKISAQDPDLGKTKSSLKGKIKGEPLEVSFNYKYLADGLSNIKGAEVTLGLTKKEGPGVLKSPKDKTYLYVVMPIKSA